MKKDVLEKEQSKSFGLSINRFMKTLYLEYNLNDLCIQESRRKIKDVYSKTTDIKPIKKIIEETKETTRAKDILQL